MTLNVLQLVVIDIALVGDLSFSCVAVAMVVRLPADVAKELQESQLLPAYLAFLYLDDLKISKN